MDDATKNQLRQMLADRQSPRLHVKGLPSGLEAIDALLPAGAFQRGAVHELIIPRQSPCPTFLAVLLGRSAQQNGGAIAWWDPDRELYLPAVAAAGIDLKQLLLLRSRNRVDLLWSLAECLRCRGLSAVVAMIPKLNQIEARRLQLAAESGGGIGVFLRPNESNECYAAATRWLVKSAPGGDRVQRWNMQLLHGHGGQVGKDLLLEVDRETFSVRVSTPLADRSAETTPARATA